MIITEKETCHICHNEFNYTYVWPKSFLPPMCQDCEDKINAETGGWVSAVYHSIKEENNPDN